MSQWSDIVDDLIKVDQAMLTKLNNQLVVLKGTDMELTIPCRLIGVEEEFNKINDPQISSFVINPLNTALDIKRFTGSRRITPFNSTTFDVKEPKQPWVTTYNISAYTQNMRIYREMQMFLADQFPIYGFITVDGVNMSTFLHSHDGTVNFANKEFIYRMTIDVWVELDIDTIGTLIKRPFNKIILKFTEKDGRAIVNNPEELDIQLP